MTYGEAIAAGGRIGGGTWIGEAHRVRLLAAELGINLDEESLVYYDVREMMSLGLRLQRALCGRDGLRSRAMSRLAASIPALRGLAVRLGVRSRTTHL
jgi:hypothetical protein